MWVRRCINDITTVLTTFTNALRGTQETIEFEDLAVDKLHGILCIDSVKDRPVHLLSTIATGLNEPDSRHALILVKEGWTVKTVMLCYSHKNKYHGCTIETVRHKLLYYFFDRELYAKIKAMREA